MKAAHMTGIVAAFAALLGTVGGAVWIITWIAGCVLAKGFWSTLFAVFTYGIWSSYLVVEKIMRAMGWA